MGHFRQPFPLKTMGGIIRDLMCKGRLKRFQTTFVFRQDDRLSLVFYTETAPSLL
ncbi:hypothetical protein HMPREF3156_02642 [Neisseria sp. HMSC06F02]|nr:hypothetical protein HMPREF3156_02642 [Neisseria sp. HMSC06F02]